MHWFAFKADEDGDGISALFKADALRHNFGEGTSKAVLHVRDESACARTLCQVDHARTVLGHHGFLGIVVEILANDQDRLAVVIPVWIRKVASAASETSPAIFFQR